MLLCERGLLQTRKKPHCTAGARPEFFVRTFGHAHIRSETGPGPNLQIWTVAAVRTTRGAIGGPQSVGAGGVRYIHQSSLAMSLAVAPPHGEARRLAVTCGLQVQQRGCQATI